MTVPEALTFDLKSFEQLRCYNRLASCTGVLACPISVGSAHAPISFAKALDESGLCISAILIARL